MMQERSESKIICENDLPLITVDTNANPNLSILNQSANSPKQSKSLWFKDVTQKLRYSMIHVLSPSLYDTALKVERRPMIDYVLNVFGRKSIVGAEIGCGFCSHAKVILRDLNCKSLYLIDSYTPYRDDSGFMEKRYLGGLENMLILTSKYKNAVFIRKTSEQAVSELPALDFCYIDANHTFDHVLEDIKNYYPRIKEDGILGGHDFDLYHPDVCKAVLNFVRMNNLKLHGSRDDWWIRKASVKE